MAEMNKFIIAIDEFPERLKEDIIKQVKAQINKGDPFMKTRIDQVFVSSCIDANIYWDSDNPSRNLTIDIIELT